MCRFSVFVVSVKCCREALHLQNDRHVAFALNHQDVAVILIDAFCAFMFQPRTPEHMQNIRLHMVVMF